MIFLAAFITTIYVGLITSFIIGMDAVKPFKTTKKEANNSFSILIPFRNEAAKLPTLLKSLEHLNYPNSKFEVVFIDDDSDDDSVKIIERHFNKLSITFSILENVQKTNSPKKDAIDTAIQHSKFNWIVTTDADCSLPENWLHTFDGFIQEKNPKMIVAPVAYESKNTFLERFQQLDFLSLMGSTQGGFGIKKPFLCNGANLCYSKQTFFEVNGFEGNNTIASGDDIFLLEKITTAYPNGVSYLKATDAIVTTTPQPTFKKLIAQRVRWAAKATAYKNKFSKFVSLTVASMNLLLIILFLGSLFINISWQLTLTVFVLKFLIDGILLFKTAAFFKQLYVLKQYLLSSLLYPLFTMFVIATSLKTDYQWKGRKFKK
tara:strand:+ start:149955 stop:151079 length:1125 start_codon:yes stop_codon:yes gene_type:complete